MNKKFLLAIFLTFLCIVNINLTAKSDGKYPEKVKSEQFYPDDLIEKHSYFNTKYARQNIPFEIKQNENNKFGMEYKHKGKIINSIPYKYDELQQCKVFGYGMFFHAKLNGKESIINWADNEIYSHKDYHLNCNRIDHSIITEYMGKNGIVLFSGKELLKPEFEIINTQTDLSTHGREFYIVKKDNLYGVINSEGEFIIPLSEEELSPMGSWFFKTSNGNVKNIYNEVILTNEYNFIEFNSPGFFRDYFKVCNDKGCGIIDTEGNVELPLSHKYNIRLTNKIKEGYFSTQLNDENSNGFIIVDSKGNIKTKEVFDVISGDFENTNTFLVMKYGIDKKCEKKCSKNNTQEKIEECNDSCDTVQYTGLINLNGEYILKPLEFDDIHPTNSNVFIVHKRTKNGYYNAIYYKNKYLIKPIHAYIDYTNGYLIIPSKTDKWKEVNINGVNLPAIDTNNVSYYILTPEELIKSHGILLFHKLYDASTIKYEDDCFHIKVKPNIIAKFYNKLFHKEPKTVDFCQK